VCPLTVTLYEGTINGFFLTLAKHFVLSAQNCPLFKIIGHGVEEDILMLMFKLMFSMLGIYTA
jgi:hypothetical protein